MKKALNLQQKKYKTTKQHYSQKKLSFMKKRILLSLVSFFAMTAMWASLTEAYQISVTAGAAGKTGDKATLTLNMKNKEAIATWTCDVVLPAGTYTDFTGLTGAATFTLAEDYHPVKFTLKEGTTTLVDAITLDELVEFVEDAGNTYAPGTVFNTSFTLSWEWVFDVPVAAPATGDDGTTAESIADPIIDAADTFLGNVAAGIVTADNIANYATGVAFADISTEINFAVTISAVQVD